MSKIMAYFTVNYLNNQQKLYKLHLLLFFEVFFRENLND